MKIDRGRSVLTFTDYEGTTGITELNVFRSNAGYYVGRYCDEGPYSRESGYYNTADQAQEALDSNQYSR
jgi:hypothetical protein